MYAGRLLDPPFNHRQLSFSIHRLILVGGTQSQNITSAPSLTVFVGKHLKTHRSNHSCTKSAVVPVQRLSSVQTPQSTFLTYLLTTLVEYPVEADGWSSALVTSEMWHKSNGYSTMTSADVVDVADVGCGIACELVLLAAGAFLH